MTSRIGSRCAPCFVEAPGGKGFRGILLGLLGARQIARCENAGVSTLNTLLLVGARGSDQLLSREDRDVRP